MLTLLASLALAGPVVVPTAVENPSALRPWFDALSRAKAGTGVARAIHYGDSTIACDGIAHTVREKLVARFGDAGPGFVTAAFDPRWHQRSDVSARKSGDWTLKTILFGGASGRYGLGGIVGIARAASATIKAMTGDAVSRQQHAEVWYQAGVGYGTAWAKADGVEIVRVSAAAASTTDDRATFDIPAGFETVTFGSTGVVPFYGVVLETGKPGVTWEDLGVVGVGSKSFTTFAGAGLASQVTMRAPDLVVIELGGNEAGYPSLLGNGGAAYRPIFEGALQTIRAGAPAAACLVIPPLDQGAVDEVTGVAASKPGMPNLVAQQRAAAIAGGCAFWDAWSAMGGKGSAVTWANARGLGTGDYVHLSGAGLERIANALADALLGAYDAAQAG